MNNFYSNNNTSGVKPASPVADKVLAKDQPATSENTVASVQPLPIQRNAVQADITEEVASPAKDDPEKLNRTGSIVKKKKKKKRKVLVQKDPQEESLEK